MQRYFRRGPAFALAAVVVALGAPAPAPAAVFSSSGSIAITDSAAPPTAANPYPATINVSGLVGTVTDVNVTLSGFAHTWPDDVDVVLVGPAGQTALLMSDVGGGDDASGVTFTFDDAAASSLPSTGLLASGAYKPSDYPEGTSNTTGTCAVQFESADDPFAAPLPAGSHGTALSVFNGTAPNGAWRLYVVDDCEEDGGSITGGWSLDITVQAPEPPDPEELVEGVRAEMSALAAGGNSATADKAEDVEAKLAAALAELAKTPPDGAAAIGNLEGAAGDLQAMVRSGLLSAAEGAALMGDLAEAGRLLADRAIADAIARGGNPAKIQEAQAALAAGDARRAAGRYKDALSRYKDAYGKAAGA